MNLVSSTERTVIVHANVLDEEERSRGLRIRLPDCVVPGGLLLVGHWTKCEV